MPFTVDTVTLEGFRSYRHAHLTLDPKLTILHGANATGKTNLIEALQLLTAGVSFRKPRAEELVNWECVQTSATLHAADGKRTRDVTLTIADGKRAIDVNGRRTRSSHEVSEALPCILFTPDDLRIVKDSSGRRRAEMDALGIQLSATYARLLSEYKRVVTQRNRLLKEDQYDTEVFRAWTDRMVEIGAALTEKRLALFERLLPHILRHYKDLDPQSTLQVSYCLSWETTETAHASALRAALEACAEDEQTRRQSLVGPHRDDIVFEIDGRCARAYGSQGQQRSIALAWKLAELAVVEEVQELRPLLLLDDVMSELDGCRRERLAALVGSVAQTVITTANIDYFDPKLLERARVLEIPKDVTTPVIARPDAQSQQVRTTPGDKQEDL